jgi:lipoprotein-anchoring transpeptidase ErfK/SrfK
VGRKAQIALGAAVGVLLVLAVGAYALDRAHSDEISDGVRVGRVDVGGLTTTEAERRIRRHVAEPIEQPVTVTFEGSKYILNADRLELRADVDGMVDAALDAGRSGGLPGRVWRYATGGEVDREIVPQITYSGDALDSFVETVTQEVDRPARDASVDFAPASVSPVTSEEGITVRAGALRSRIEAAIGSARHRAVRLPVDRVEPEVTTAELADQYPVLLTVDRANFQLRLWKDLKLVKTYTVAVGQAGYETPAGVYEITDRQVNPAWHVPDSDWAGDLAGTVVPPGPSNPLQARWMGFYNGAGIHGTNDPGSLGTAASHGCIRMAVPDVIELYDQVPYGTPIYLGG